MSVTIADPAWAQDCERLVQIAEAQITALGADDFTSFTALSEERDRLHLHLDHAVAPEGRAALLRALREVQRLDGEAGRLVALRLAELGRELGRVRAGHTALAAYARPGGHLHHDPASVDRAG